MTSSTSNTSQPAPNNKMRAASALISKSRSLLSSTSTQQYPVGPFINSSQATRNAGVHNGNEDLSSSPDSETSGDNSKDIEEIQDTLTRAPRGENASSNGTVVSHTKSRLTLSEITETVSQNDDDEDDLVEEEEFASE